MKQLKKTGDNMGGVLRIWAIPPGVVSVSGKTVNISSDADVYELVCSEGTKGLSQKKEKTNAGTIYNIEVQGFLPKIEKELMDELPYLNNHKWVVLIIDGNGLPLLVGSSTYPLHFESEMDTGADTPQRAGVRFRFYRQTTEPAIVVDNPF